MTFSKRILGSIGGAVLAAVLVAGCAGTSGVSDKVDPTPAHSAAIASVATSSATATIAPTATPVVTAVPTAAPTPVPTAAPTAWAMNVYSGSGVVWQQDSVSCTAASTVIMLNFAGGWAGASQSNIMAYERANMTMLTSSAGSDPHGWRNALNYYGWGSMNAGVYADRSYSSFAAASKAAVVALATTGKPVGILGWAGRHAQILNGYSVTGADPRTGSTAFTINTVYITDPLSSDGYRNAAISSATWSGGSSKVAFVPYHETDSPYTDPIDGHVGKTEWYGMYVLILPVK